MKKHSFTVLAVLAAVILFAFNTYASGGQGAHWAYKGADGPANWGNLSADYAVCKTGTSQSPIDISKTARADLGDI
jgi:carbonic anhydrase